MTIKELIRKRKSSELSEPTNTRDDDATPHVLTSDGELDDESLERIAGGQARPSTETWDAVW